MLVTLKILPSESRFDISVQKLPATSDDLLIISKIIRRAPRIADASTLKQRLDLARELCEVSAIMGNPDAILFWSEEILRSGRSSASDRERAMSRLTQLATQKNGKANLLIANEIYSLGQEKQAMKAYRLAGEQGIPEAYTKLGRILRQQGYHRQSVAAFQLAADAGEPNAQFMMSTFSTNEHEKIQYLQKAASNGKEEAAHNLGELYRKKGQTALAKEYLLVAAQKGFQVSQMNLAGLLRTEKDFAGAELWYAAAIRAGGEIATHAESLLAQMKSEPEYRKDSTGRWCSLM